MNPAENDDSRGSWTEGPHHRFGNIPLRMQLKFRGEWGLFAASLLFALAGAEGLTRAFSTKPLPHLGYAPVRDHRAAEPQNRLEYRDVEHDLKRKPGVHRALFVGDSFTYGQGVAFDDTFPKRVERLLTESRKEPWETIVVAVPGIGTGREARLFERDGLPFEPDVMVLGYVLNDGEDHDAGELRRAEEWRQEEERAKNPPWWTRSALLSFGWGRIEATLQNRRREANYRGLFEGEKPGFTGSKESLVKIGALAKAHHIPWIAAIFPLLGNALDESYPFVRAHERVAAAAESAGALVLDLLPTYRDKNWRLLVVEGEADEHPNELAHRLAAEAIAPAVDKLIQSRIP